MSNDHGEDLLSASDDGVQLRIKVVPGASRGRIAGRLGDRLKIAVAAPAEGGKANRAVCELLAEAFGDVQIVAGQTRPQKTVALLGLDLCRAVERLKGILTA